MEYLPLFINLKNKPILIVGGGDIALRKIYFLQKTGAIIKIVAKTLCPALQQILCVDKIVWIDKIFQPIMLKNIYLVIVATNDSNLNSMIFNHAERNNILINTVDDESKCSCIFPAIVNRFPILIGISSCGKAPVLVRILREKIESLLPMFLGSIANIAGFWRDKVKRSITDLRLRRLFWEKLFNNSYFTSLIERGQLGKAYLFVQNFIDIYNNNSWNKPGHITLVGAGPGDIGLLTIRGLQVMQQADIILYDHLVNLDILDLARRESNKICVGKYSGQHLISQKELNKLMIQLAKQGNNVVRLKGGDAFIFGRGGEELQEIYKADDITVQVIPGITAAIGVAAYAGIPLTHREYAHSVTFMTGHITNNKINWKMLSDQYQTLVIYMVKQDSMNISKKLILYGRYKDTPVAVISRGTYKNQKILIGKLIELEKLVLMVEQPIILIIGNVVSLYNTKFKSNDNYSYEINHLFN